MTSTRTIEPPSLVNTTLRTVWSSKPIAATVCGAAGAGLAAQTETQCLPSRVSPADRADPPP